MAIRVIRIAGLVLIVLCWRWALRGERTDFANLVLIFSAPLCSYPISLFGRRLLAARPTLKRVEWTNTFVHYAIMIALGVSIFPAIQSITTEPRGGVLLPRPLGVALELITGFATVFTVFNLAWRGLGAPFAVKPSSRLATDWLYAWTRNPMLLCTLALLLSVGLRHGSPWFLVWLCVSVAPAWIFFIKIYEERELAIRFGPSYLDYKARTSFLWPRRPRIAVQARAQNSHA
jgi:protein-S-isoprenylcysteine O-methyltransferase Ste14